MAVAQNAERLLPVVPDPSLVYCPHPLSAMAGRKTISAKFLIAESIDRYLTRIGLLLNNKPVVLMLNDVVIPRDKWATTYPKTDDLISIRAIAHGGDEGSNPIATILMLAVMIVAPGVGGVIAEGVAGVSAGVASAVFSMGSSLVIQALFPPASPKMSQIGHDDKSSPTYSLTGGSNRARPYEPLPLVLGEHRIYPDKGANEYSEFVGEDQYFYQTFNAGLSDVDLSLDLIGTTSVDEYDDVEIEVSGEDGKLILFPGNVDPTSGGSITYEDGDVIRVSSAGTTALAVDLSGTLFALDEFNRIVNHSVDIGIDYKEVGGIYWAPLSGGTAGITITNGSRKPIRLTYRKDVPEGQYEVRVKRHSPDDDGEKHFSDIKWYQLKSFQPDAADYTGQKRIALKIRASGQLNGVVNRYSVLAKAKVPVWTGSAWETRVTSNPAWQVLWLARGKKINNVRAFGALLPDERLEIEGFKEWAAWCDAKNLTCNLVFDRAMNTNEMLATVARVGRGALSWTTGRLGVIWDQADLPRAGKFGMANIRRDSFRVDYITGKLADEFTGTFIDPDNDWQQMPVRATVPGVTNPTNTANVGLLIGVTNKDQAGRDLLMQAARQKYWRRRIHWETDAEGLSVGRGDVVEISHDLTQWGYSGRLVAGTKSQLTLSRKVVFTHGKVHYVGVRAPNGFYGIYEVSFQNDAIDTLQLVDHLPFDIDQDRAVDYLWFFEPKATPGRRVKIVDLRPKSMDLVSITAVDDDPRYYLSEYEEFTYLGPSVVGDINLPRISNLDIDETLIKAGPGYTVRLELVWDVEGLYGGAFIRASINGEPMQDKGRTTGRRFEIQVPDSGDIEIEIVAFDLQGRWSDLSKYRAVHSIHGKNEMPPDVSNFTIDRQADGTRELNAVAAEPADFAGYEIRYKSGQGHTWDEMDPLNKQGLITAFPLETNQIPKGFWTLAIKMVDTSGNRSANAKYIYTELGDPRLGDIAVLDNAKAKGFPGIKTDCWVNERGELEALDPTTFADLDADSWADRNRWADNPAPLFQYIHETDAGGVLQFTPLVEITTDGDSSIEYSTSVDGIDWTAYSAIPESATARYLRAKVTVQGHHALNKVTALTVMLSAEAKRLEVNDLNVAALTGLNRLGVGDIRLPLSEPLILITQVQIALQNVGPGWSWEIIDKHAALGPRVRFYNASHVLADPSSIDALIRGV